MDTKSIFTSKTVWTNVVAVAATFLAPKLGFAIGAEEQVAILAVVNLVLRAITKQPVAWS